MFDPAAEEPALRKAVDGEEAAWNGADAKALATLFRDDATYADAFGGVARGRAEVDKRIAEVLSAWRGTRIALKVRKVRVLKPDVALVEADAELTGWKKLPPGFRAEDDQILRSRLLQVFQKEAGGGASRPGTRWTSRRSSSSPLCRKSARSADAEDFRIGPWSVCRGRISALPQPSRAAS